MLGDRQIARVEFETSGIEHIKRGVFIRPAFKHGRGFSSCVEILLKNRKKNIYRFSCRRRRRAITIRLFTIIVDFVFKIGLLKKKKNWGVRVCRGFFYALFCLVCACLRKRQS